MTIVLLSEEMNGKQLKQFNKNHGTTILKKQIRNTTQEDSQRIRESVHKADFMKKIREGKIQPISRRLKT